MASGGADSTKTDAVWRVILLPKASTKVVRVLTVILRVVATMATITAALLMGLNKETKSTTVAIVGTTPFFLTLTAKFSHTPAFVFFVIANGIASTYNLMVLFLGFLLSKRNTYYIFLHLMDMTMMALVATAAAAAASMAELGKNGNLHARWSPICDKFEDFCHRGGLAIAAAFVGAALLLVLNAHTILALHKNAAVLN